MYNLDFARFLHRYFSKILHISEKSHKLYVRFSSEPKIYVYMNVCIFLNVYTGKVVRNMAEKVNKLFVPQIK